MSLTKELRTVRNSALLSVVAVLTLLTSFVAASGSSAAVVAPQDLPTARLQIASFTSPIRAAAFIRDHQLGWNECVLGRELGVLPPGWTELPERCTAQTDVEVLEVRQARVHGSTFHRVVTRPLPVDEL